jgi:hypothetical protein
VGLGKPRQNVAQNDGKVTKRTALSDEHTREPSQESNETPKKEAQESGRPSECVEVPASPSPSPSPGRRTDLSISVPAAEDKDSDDDDDDDDNLSERDTIITNPFNGPSSPRSPIGQGQNGSRLKFSFDLEVTESDDLPKGIAGLSERCRDRYESIESGESENDSSDDSSPTQLRKDSDFGDFYVDKSGHVSKIEDVEYDVEYKDGPTERTRSQ